MHAIFSANHTLLDLITLIMFGETIYKAPLAVFYSLLLPPS